MMKAMKTIANPIKLAVLVATILIQLGEASERDDIRFGNMTTFLTSYSYVNHLEPDRRIDGNVLFSDGNSLRTSSGGIITTVAGSTSYGYRDGYGTSARFRTVWGFVQPDRDTIIAADYSNHCLRQINRTNGYTQTLVGRCGYTGFVDGFTARFYGPLNIIFDARNSSQIFVADYYNHAIRMVDLLTENVSTIIRNSGVHYPRAMLMVDRDNLITTNNYYVARYRFSTGNTWKFTSGSSAGSTNGAFSVARFRYMSGMAKVTPQTLIVSDGYYFLRILNFKNKTVSSVCSGSFGYTDGSPSTCRLYYPRGLTLTPDGYLYIGQYKRIRRIKVDVLNNECPAEPLRVSADPSGYGMVSDESCGGSENQVRLPIGVYGRVVDLGISVCNSTMTVFDSNFRIQIAMTAKYTLDCSMLTSGVNDTIQSVLQHHIATLADACRDLSCVISVDQQVAYQCVGTVLTVRWVTQSYLPAGYTNADLRAWQRAFAIIKPYQLSVVVCGQSNPVIVPMVNEETSTVVQLELIQTCVGGKIFNPETNTCQSV